MIILCVIVVVPWMLLTAHTLEVKFAKVHLLRSIGLQSYDEFRGYLRPKKLVEVPTCDKLKLAYDENSTYTSADGQADVALFKDLLLLHFFE